MLSVLVIGAGTMGQAHMDAYQQMDNIQLAGVVEEVPERRERMSQNDCPVFASIEQAAATLNSLDIVDICVPTPYHKDCVIKAAQLVSNIICEKPLARTLEDAREMITYCQKKGVNLFVGHVVRFFPEYQQAKKIIESGEIGTVGVVRTFRGGVFPQGFNNWYQDKDKSGGLILDLIIHDFDFLRWTLGEVERVYAKSLSDQNHHEFDKDYCLVTLRFKSGAIAHVEGSWAHQGFNMAFEFAGKEGIVDYNSAKATPILAVTADRESSFSGVAVPQSPLNNNPYYRELSHFIDCIQNSKQPIVTAEDAYRAIEIAVSALQSSQTGKAVTLGEGVTL